MRTFAVTRRPRYEGYDDLHGTAKLAPDEFLILIDGAEIGGTYWCSYNPAASAGWGSNDGGLPGESWASWGPRGLSCGHPTREAAEHAQVREYVTDPDGHDRQAAMARAEQQAEQARRQAEREAEDERREAERRRERLGDDEPGPTVWTLPSYHALYADADEVVAVADWLEANGIEDVSGQHEVRVEQRATRRAAVYEAPLWVWNGRSSTTTETRVVTLVTDPPTITAPDRPDLHEVFAEHWPARFPLIDFGLSIACAKCTRDAKATIAEQMAAWPCAVVEKAIAA
ncbi:hypothetical protein HD597_012854 [Nonomuraea thailandensis]|uniref:Uncharacterized protein n=1 Tax=Nonomuraea thailandensis TaxID=1188745 RepID=A0A9X2GXE4_9ACTN|nr:hypothetical protein [Nonomuraea thailandensis]MCP2365750.1 hypothetical protein [Nonomuraea thailandensis]